jgi:hypothetical protein
MYQIGEVPLEANAVNPPNTYYSCVLEKGLSFSCTVFVSSEVTRDNWKPISIRMHGRPKNRWEDDVMADLRIQNVKNWRNCIQNRKKWKGIVEKAKTYKG